MGHNDDHVSDNGGILHTKCAEQGHLTTVFVNRFPLVLVPSYKASGGDPVIFYGVTAGILAGAVAGDHASPISDTTILASMASECEILQHVRTQAPYAMMVALWSVLVGTIPSGRATFANWVSIVLGFVAMLFHAVFTAEFALHKTGRYDIFTELYLRCARDKEFLTKLKEDTVRAYETGAPVPLADSDKLVEDVEDVEKSVEKGGSASATMTASHIVSGTFPKSEQVAAEDVEKQEQAVGEESVKQVQADEAMPVVRELSEEPEVEEHLSGEEKTEQ